MCKNALPSRAALLLFTRYPVPSVSKPHLIPALGPDGAAEYQRSLTELTLGQVREFARDRDVSLAVHYADGSAEELREWLGADLAWGECLGERLPGYHVEQACATGLQATLLAGHEVNSGSCDVAGVLTFDRTSDSPVGVFPERRSYERTQALSDVWDNFGFDPATGGAMTSSVMAVTTTRMPNRIRVAQKISAMVFGGTSLLSTRSDSVTARICRAMYGRVPTSMNSVTSMPASWLR